MMSRLLYGCTGDTRVGNIFLCRLLRSPTNHGGRKMIHVKTDGFSWNDFTRRRNFPGARLSSASRGGHDEEIEDSYSL